MMISDILLLAWRLLAKLRYADESRPGQAYAHGTARVPLFITALSSLYERVKCHHGPLRNMEPNATTIYSCSSNTHNGYSLCNAAVLKLWHAGGCKWMMRLSSARLRPGRHDVSWYERGEEIFAGVMRCWFDWGGGGDNNSMTRQPHHYVLMVTQLLGRFSCWRNICIEMRECALCFIDLRLPEMPVMARKCFLSPYELKSIIVANF